MIGDMGQHELGIGPTELPCLDHATVHAYVADTLADDRRAAVIAHLDGCAACRELVDDVTLGRTLGQAPPPEFGSYRLGTLIAQGGMGRIYRAFDTTLQRDVALKVPRSASPAMMRRFEREAAITARLQHPGIVPLHAAGHSSDGTPFYVMRLVDGRTLDRVVVTTPSPEARLRLVEHVVAVADTMAYVHDKRIVHRDLKPNNVLIGEFGETLIIDWGLAKRLEDRASLPAIGLGASSSARDALHTRAGDVLGTPAFMPPEQAAGEPVDERGDVYAIGALLRYVLAGRVVTPTEELDAPAPLLAVAKRALAVRPADRYANAGELVLALRAALAPPTRSVEPPRSGRLTTIASVIAMVAIAGLVVWGLWPRHAEPTPVEQQLVARLPADALRPALSPNGKRVAYGSYNRLDVRDLESGRQWTRPAWLAWPFTVEFPTDYIVLFTENAARERRRMMRWNLLTDSVEQVGPEFARYWIGTLADGPVWIDNHLGKRLSIATPAGDVDVPSKTEQPLRLYAISPDRRRLAFVENTAAGSMLRLVEGARGPTFTTRVEDVAAIAFLDADTLLYSAGTLDGSTIYRLPIEGGAFGRPEPVFSTARSGWLGTLAAANGRVVGSYINSSFESRLHERATHAERHLEKVAASATLGWRDIVSYWVFNSATGQIERHSISATELPIVTRATVTGDPANATMAGELLVITLRGGEGREVIAVHPDEATPRWAAARGVLSFVRCAGDRAPPCIAARRAPSGNSALVWIDPQTGVLGDEVVAEADIADAAVDSLGLTLAWVVDNSELHVRPLDGSGPERVVGPKRSGIHSLAFDPTGGLLVSITSAEGRLIARFSDGRAETVANAGQTIVSLIRPSPDGTQLLYRARTLASDLIDIRIP